MGVHKTRASATELIPNQETRRVTRSMSTRSLKRQNQSLKNEPVATAQSATTSTSTRRRKSTGKTSHFHPNPWSKTKPSSGSPISLIPAVILEKAIRQPGQPLSETRFGLIQESLADNLYALVIQAILWNQTTGKQARPVLEQMLSTYPTPKALAAGRFEDVVEMLYPIGLYNSRARRLLDMARTWVEKPPVPGRGYTKVRNRKYTDVPIVEVEIEDGQEVVAKPEEAENAEAATDTSFWEIAHLPGVGPYALDSFRIFHRDKMRGLADNWLGKAGAPNMEPEWKRVLPADKELRAYLKWSWAREGWDWNWETGKRESFKMPPQ